MRRAIIREPFKRWLQAEASFDSQATPFETGRIPPGGTLERGARGMLGEFPNCSVAVDYSPITGLVLENAAGSRNRVIQGPQPTGNIFLFAVHLCFGGCWKSLDNGDDSKRVSSRFSSSILGRSCVKKISPDAST